MKVKLLEFYQDKHNHFAPGQVVDVDDVLAKWLFEHRKAERVFDARHLDVEPQFEQAEEPPQPAKVETKHQDVKRPRRGRGAK